MMPTVQLALLDPAYRAALRDALLRSGPWQVETVDWPDLSARCVLVIDDEALSRTPLPLPYPERVVLIDRTGNHEVLEQAWEAGIVSVISAGDRPSTVLLAIMAAALRVPQAEHVVSGISPSRKAPTAPLSPTHRAPSPKHRKNTVF